MSKARVNSVHQLVRRLPVPLAAGAAGPLRLLILLLVGLMAVPSPGLAQSRATDLSQMSIEDLMKIEITSASRKEQRARDIAAAVFVITHEDIRRSGMTTIPELLRLAPGVQVAQINSNKWAVSMRGFNDLYSNKLLVLVDGRSIYNRVFSGVFWDSPDLMLDDIDRIEVIRGPGAAMWGANAVNGVINIVTKVAADTRGGLVRVGSGNSGTQGAVRYGGTLGAARYRLFAQGTGLEESLIAPGTRANDRSYGVTTGFRADWAAQPGTLTMDGAFTTGQAHALWTNLDPQTSAREPIAHDPSDRKGGHVRGRWTGTRASGASLQVQSSLDFSSRQDPVGNYDRRVFEVDSQYHRAIGTHQDLVVGAGYRFSSDTVVGRGGLSFAPDRERSSLVTAFIADEIALFGNRLAVTVGSQVQHDSYSGIGVQPTARIMWKGLPHQRLWAAASRALRTPSIFERWIRIELPPAPHPSGLPLIITVVGNPAQETEHFDDAEAGYRLEIGKAASIDVTGFVGRYDHLRTQEPGAPVVQFVPSPSVFVTSQFGNQLAATTRGLEVAGNWTPIPSWRLDGSYTAFRATSTLAATSLDPVAGMGDGNAPSTQWRVRSAFSPVTRATFDVSIFHAGALAQLQVAAYTRADVNGEWRFTNHVSAMVTGRNLFDSAHAEFSGAASLVLATQVPRSVGLGLRWAF